MIMRYAFYTLLFFVLLGAAHVVHAQEVTFGEYSVSYDEVVEFDENGDGSTDKWSYRSGEEPVIVLTAFDTSGDGQQDLWLRYDEESVLDLEAHDTDGDVEADVFFELNEDEEVTKESGDGLAQFEKPKPLDPDTGGSVQQEAVDSDGGGGAVWWIIVILLVVGGFFGWRKYKRK